MPKGEMTCEKFTQAKQSKYFELLQEGFSKRKAARGSGVSHVLVAEFRKRTPGFKELEDKAQEKSCEAIEDALYNKALDGDTVACQVWLYNRMPNRWSDKRNQLSIDHVLSLLTPDTRRRVVSELGRLARAGLAPGVGGETTEGAGKNGSNGATADHSLAN